MPETIRKGIWRWYDVMRDLDEQGGLGGVIIEPTCVDKYSFGGTTASGTRFAITWIFDIVLLVTMNKEESELVEAFANVVGYRPFCSYVEDNGLFTFEWDKRGPEGRYSELEKEGKRKLKRLQ